MDASTPEPRYEHLPTLQPTRRWVHQACGESKKEWSGFMTKPMTSDYLKLGGYKAIALTTPYGEKEKVWRYRDSTPYEELKTIDYPESKFKTLDEFKKYVLENHNDK